MTPNPVPKGVGVRGVLDARRVLTPSPDARTHVSECVGGLLGSLETTVLATLRPPDQKWSQYGDYSLLVLICVRPTEGSKWLPGVVRCLGSHLPQRREDGRPNTPPTSLIGRRSRTSAGISFSSSVTLTTRVLWVSGADDGDTCRSQSPARNWPHGTPSPTRKRENRGVRLPLSRRLPSGGRGCRRVSALGRRSLSPTS